MHAALASVFREEAGRLTAALVRILGDFALAEEIVQDALVAALGVVHLDLNPLNLLRHQDGRLLLSDFGLAHLMKEGEVQGGTSLSFGPPLYMAPEHLRGQPDWRSDLYALGVMLYQMLTGRLPFEGSTPEAIMLKHVMDPPPPLESGQAKVLAKQPEHRYQRAGELLAGFRAALGGHLSHSVTDVYSAPMRISQPVPITTMQATSLPRTSGNQYLSNTPSASARNSSRFKKAIALLLVFTLLLAAAIIFFITSNIQGTSPELVSVVAAQIDLGAGTILTLNNSTKPSVRIQDTFTTKQADKQLAPANAYVFVNQDELNTDLNNKVVREDILAGDILRANDPRLAVIGAHANVGFGRDHLLGRMMDTPMRTPMRIRRTTAA